MKRILGISLVLVASMLWASAETSVVASVEKGHGGNVYVIPIEDQIESALIYVIRRGVDEAKEAKADAVVFTMHTPGGTLGAAEEICRLIQSLPMPAYTLVEKNAFSAGAIIAMSTKRIFMQPGSVIGDAMPIMMSMFGGVEEMPEDVKEKMVSGVCALIRANAQQNGYDPELAECMVRIDKEYAIGEDFKKEKGRLLTLTDQEAAKLVGKDKDAPKKPLLSSGTVKDLDEMLEKIGMSGAKIHRLEVTGAEKVARWIAAMAPLLLMAGLLGLYIEFKSPGLILPGVLGAICLALFFWGHHIAGLTGMEEVVIFLIGIALILVEIYVFPGHMLPGVIGIACVFIALLMAMVPHMPDAPPPSAIPSAPPLPPVAIWELVRLPLLNLAITIIGAGFGGALIARYLPQSRLASPLVLAHEHVAKKGYVSAETENSLVGQMGEAVTMLRPAGAARIGGRQYDVVTRGDFIKPGAKVRVVEAQANRIVVEAA